MNLKRVEISEMDDFRDDPVSRFKVLAERFCDILLAHEIRLRAMEGDSPRHFHALPREVQAQVLTGLEGYLALFAECAQNSESLRESRRFVWRALRRMGAVPREDILDKIDDGDVVEIYIPGYLQSFRNLRFFEYVTCTIEELLCLPIWEIVEFPASVQEELTRIGEKFFTGSILQTFQPGIPPYTAIERLGERTALEIALKWMSPLATKEGQVFGVLITNRSRFV